MKRAIVVVEDSENSRAMVREAGELAAGVGAELLLYAEVTETDISNATTVISSTNNDDSSSHTSSDAIDSVHQFLNGIATEQFDGLNVDYETACSVVPNSGHAQSVIRAGESNNCDHLFVVGERRSPTGKALFGDFVQSLLLNFDGAVTVDLRWVKDEYHLIGTV